MGVKSVEETVEIEEEVVDEMAEIEEESAKMEEEELEVMEDIGVKRKTLEREGKESPESKKAKEIEVGRNQGD